MSKNDVDKATKKILKYFYLRQNPAPFFRNWNPESEKNRNLFGSLFAVPLRNLPKDREVILLTGLLKPTTKYSPQGHLKLIALTVDYLLWDKTHTFTDLKILLHGKKFRCPAMLEKPCGDFHAFVSEYQSSIPIRLEGFYILQPPEYIKEIARVYDGLRFTTIQSLEEVSLYFQPTLLPFEFGGCLGHLTTLLDRWNRQCKQRSQFFSEFEKRMIHDYKRRMFHEKEVREGGRNWVAKIKLCSDETEFKRKYYERMANMRPMIHPAFGRLRRENKPKITNPEDPLKKFRQMLTEEEEAEEKFSKAVKKFAAEGTYQPSQPFQILLCKQQSQ